MKLYSVKEAAQILGVSTNTLYKYVGDGRIHAARGSAIQGRFRIPESSLEEFLGVKLSKPEPEPAITSPQSEAEIPSDAKQSVGAVGHTKLPLKLSRFLLVVALVAVLVDLVIARTVSLPAELSRLLFLAVMILLSYQEGGFRRAK